MNSLKTGFEEEKMKYTKKLADKNQEIIKIKTANDKTIDLKQKEFDEKLKIENAQIEETKKALDDKDQEIADLKDSKEKEMDEIKEKMSEMEKELVQSEIRFTDLQELAESKSKHLNNIFIISQCLLNDNSSNDYLFVHLIILNKAPALETFKFYSSQL